MHSNGATPIDIMKQGRWLPMESTKVQQSSRLHLTKHQSPTVVKAPSGKNKSPTVIEAPPGKAPQPSHSHQGYLWQPQTTSSHPGFCWQSTKVQQSACPPLATKVQQYSRLPLARHQSPTVIKATTGKKQKSSSDLSCLWPVSYTHLTLPTICSV